MSSHESMDSVGWPIQVGPNPIIEKIKSARNLGLIRGFSEGLTYLQTDEASRSLLVREAIRSGNDFVKAVALACYTTDDIPPIYQEQFSIKLMPEINAEPVFTYPNWDLCYYSEERMVNAIKEKAVIVVGGLMVKFHGRITGLCFESFSSSRVTFIKGQFYSPDIPTQDELKDNFVRGNNIPKLSHSKWVLMREVYLNSVDTNMVVQQSKAMAESMPRVIPEKINNVDREIYLKNRKELYPGQTESVQPGI